jgi:hypothetical protein
MVATGADKFGGLGGSNTGDTTQATTYAEMLRNDSLTPAEENQIKADALLGITAVLLRQRGQQDVARMLLDVIQSTVDPSSDRYEPDDLWFEVAPEQMDEFVGSVVEKIRDACHEVCKRRNYDLWFGGVREILPDVGPDWREGLAQPSGGKRPTNHARRVRPEPKRPTEDWLSFTNDGELTVYRTLKKQQESMPPDETIGIFPLPGGRLPGKTWEPDLLVTYKGRAGVIEIDGPHHNARRALDTTRDHMWLDAGVAFVDRILVETLSNPRELEAVLKRFLKRLAETRLWATTRTKPRLRTSCTQPGQPGSY